MKLISVVTPCYNEEDNVEELYEQVKAVFAGLHGYVYEHIFIDNASTDKTAPILRRLAALDKNVKVIVNARNFGQVRSPYHALMQATGDAVIGMAADLQDPPQLIREFITRWEEGYRIVLGVKVQAEESPLFYFMRSLYYRALRKLSETELIEHATGFGLYDRSVIEILRGLNDRNPYFRGLLADIGFPVWRVGYRQPLRKRGITKNNFFSLYDMAMLGMTSYSRIPLRLATMLGFAVALISMLVAVAYTAYKLVFWNNFSVGTAPLVIGLFFFGAVQLIFIGIIGEYVGAIHTQVLDRPLVVEKERINF